jgi:hypothetical protein
VNGDPVEGRALEGELGGAVAADVDPRTLSWPWRMLALTLGLFFAAFVAGGLASGARTTRA